MVPYAASRPEVITYRVAPMADERSEALRLAEMPPCHLEESITGPNVQHPLVHLLRRAVYSRLAGYEDANDAELLAPQGVLEGIDRRCPAPG